MKLSTWTMAVAGVGLALALTSLGCKGNEAPAPAPAADATPAPQPEAAADAAPATPPAADAGAQQAKPTEADAQAAAGQEVVFDPASPPKGWFNCHRNHCHHETGRVGSYAQVMQEMGATKMVGGSAPAAMPAAPPDVAAPPADAEKTASGLASKVLTPGKGTTKPTATSVVTVHYTGWTTDGKAFDSSVSRGQPARFPLNRVIPGWTEGLQLMVEGEERRFWIPANLAYEGRPGRPQGMLVFDVELLGIDQ